MLTAYKFYYNIPVLNLIQTMVRLIIIEKFRKIGLRYYILRNLRSLLSEHPKPLLK